MSRKLKEIYDLNYDKSSINSGLIQWYNKLIDKKYEELDVADVSKMIRQTILKKTAINKAIELFCDNPYDGEMYDGDLLNLIVSFDQSILKEHELNKKLIKTIDIAIVEYSNFEWVTEDKKILFQKNILKLRKLLLDL